MNCGMCLFVLNLKNIQILQFHIFTSVLSLSYPSLLHKYFVHHLNIFFMSSMNDSFMWDWGRHGDKS